MRKNQNGFGILEALLFVVFISLLIGVFWYFFNGQKKSDETTVNNSSLSENSQTPVSSMNDGLKFEATSVELLSGIKSEAPISYGTASTQSVISGVVGFITPDDWRPDSEFTSEGCGITDCIGQSVIVPAFEETSTSNYPDYFAVTISAFQTNQDAKIIFADNWQDEGEAAVLAYSNFVTTDGVEGFKYDFAFDGNDSQGNYTEHVAYGISRDGKVVILDVTYFNGSNKSFQNVDNTDYGQYAAVVEQIAKSLRIEP